MNEEDDEFVVDKTGYRIVLKKSKFSYLQAQVLTKAIAEEANVISKQIVENADYTQYLALFDQSIIYDHQIEYLQRQYNLIYGMYTNLISQYGDVVINSNQKLSDIQLNMQEYFQNISFDSLRKELIYNGYVKVYDDYLMLLDKQIDELKREEDVTKKKKNELISQRDALLDKAGTLYSIELSAYNDEIITLSNSIFDIEESISLLELQRDNKDRADSDLEYKNNILNFEEKLNNHYQKLTEMTNDYTTIEKSVVKKYSTIYYDSNSIIVKKNAINVILFIALSFVGSFVIAVIVNLCIDGKKLTKKYREEQTSNFVNETK